jgi:hypothetical protein
VLTEKVYGKDPPLTEMVQPAYAVACVPPGHVEVVIVNGPPDPVVAAVTVTVAVEVVAPVALLAESV